MCNSHILSFLSEKYMVQIIMISNFFSGSTRKFYWWQTSFCISLWIFKEEIICWRQQYSNFYQLWKKISIHIFDHSFAKSDSWNYNIVIINYIKWWVQIFAILLNLYTYVLHYCTYFHFCSDSGKQKVLVFTTSIYIDYSTAP